MDQRGLAGRFVPANVPSGPAPLDRILIKDLVLPCRIGVHAHERLGPQRVRINVELEVRAAPVAVDDDIGNVLSYEGIVTGIKTVAGDAHINLVETLAERIAKVCLSDERAVAARIRVEKLDVEPDAAAVGIAIERRR